MQLISEDELTALKSLLRQVYRRRGWRLGPVAFDAAWHCVMEAAATDVGGAWRPDFTPAHMTPAALTALLLTIDRLLLGGALTDHIAHLTAAAAAAAAGRPAASAGRRHAPAPSSPAAPQPLRCESIVRAPGANDWLCYFGTDNAVHLNQDRWRQVVSEQRPLSCEGVLCTSKLQLLVHTLGHELVHGVVLNFWPDMDRASAAYLPADRHGPIFKLLNLRLMGHASESYRDVFPAGQRGGGGGGGAGGRFPGEVEDGEGPAAAAAAAPPTWEDLAGEGGLLACE